MVMKRTVLNASNSISNSRYKYIFSVLFVKVFINKSNFNVVIHGLLLSALLLPYDPTSFQMSLESCLLSGADRSACHASSSRNRWVSSPVVKPVKAGSNTSLRRRRREIDLRKATLKNMILKMQLHILYALLFKHWERRRSSPRSSHNSGRIS